MRKLRELRDSGEGNGHSPEAWSAMVETGWTGILVPEDQGGSDLGYLTFGVVLEELGRQLTPSPLLASALVGASALRLGGTEAQKAEWLPKIVDGSAILTLAVDEGLPARARERTALARSSRSGELVSSSTAPRPFGPRKKA
ncbi:MAG: acyl-CoA dehydrogenase family protein [Gammaproteobacteria bacterium]|nr:acyl-CoA dehydrogenase family protein [Gammaproteobacteria bacterium]